MKPLKKTEEAIRRRLHARASSGVHDRVLSRVRQAREEDQEITRAPHEPIIGRFIVKSSMARLAVAAVIVAAVVLGAFEFSGTEGGSGVVWAEVAQKVEASGGYTFHKKFRIVRSDRPEEIVYIAAYVAGSRIRHDWRLQPEGELFRTQYYDFDAAILVEANHSKKRFLRVGIDEKTQQARQSGWLNAKDWIRQFLASEYRKLGRRVIDGVPCEGIETTDSTFGGQDPPAAKSLARLWVSVETGYPVRMDMNSTHAHESEDIQCEVLCERFQWDVELRPDLFEPNTPADYKGH